LAIRISQATFSSLDTLLCMPVKDLIDLAEEVSEVCQATAR